MLDRPQSVRVACFATQGAGSQDEARIVELLGDLTPEVVPFARGNRLSGAWKLMRALLRARPDLVVMEGTGIAGGAVLLLLRLLGQRYVVSSGDAVAPFLRAKSRALGPLGGLYERVLYRFSSGFIGWSPYLVGRALTFGAPRAMTAANWSEPSRADARDAVRDRLGISRDTIVFGIVGSLNWSSRLGYCYGWELVSAARLIDRTDLRVLIIGDGDGRDHLAALAHELPPERVIFTGRVPRSELAGYFAAIDVASLPQSVDGVGSFRYTTKLSEYLAAGLPIVTGQIPLAYDLDDGWMWRLPGEAPWDVRYVQSLAALMSEITHQTVRGRKPTSRAPLMFDRRHQVHQVGTFVEDIIAARNYQHITTV